MSGEAINLSKSMNPSLICSIKSSPPTISAPAALASSIFSPAKYEIFYGKMQPARNVKFKNRTIKN